MATGAQPAEHRGNQGGAAAKLSDTPTTEIPARIRPNSKRGGIALTRSRFGLAPRQREPSNAASIRTTGQRRGPGHGIAWRRLRGRTSGRAIDHLPQPLDGSHTRAQRPRHQPARYRISSATSPNIHAARPRDRRECGVGATVLARHHTRDRLFEEKKKWRGARVGRSIASTRPSNPEKSGG